METPARNDSYNDLLYKLAKNLYDYGVTLGKTGLDSPHKGDSDFNLLKAAVTNSAAIATP